jgi:hypothetical protein
MLSDDPFVGVYATGEEHENSLSSEKISKSVESLILNAPLESGEYEVRAYAKRYVYVDANLVTKAVFSVGGDAKDAYKITLNKTSFPPVRSIMVNVSDVPGEMLSEGPFVGVYSIDGKHNNYQSRQKISRSVESLFLKTPIKPGEYEVRAYAKSGVYIDANLVTKATFAVMKDAKGIYALALDKTRYVPREKITVNVSGVPAGILSDKPFVAVYASGASHKNYQSWGYIRNVTDNITLLAPKEEGEYEVRGYAQDGVYIDSDLVGTVRFSVKNRE